MPMDRQMNEEQYTRRVRTYIQYRKPVPALSYTVGFVSQAWCNSELLRNTYPRASPAISLPLSDVCTTPAVNLSDPSFDHLAPTCIDATYSRAPQPNA
jgi:hypothetical protein